ncbi:cupin domain-containing protein [Caldalkalibacillus mannanilyticus]|uniref:cupin domain-containing protein n=1 Tax=Caldalkalibacillus mannanilyticus TaxID=1418 RepID=UPI000469B8DC|nr:cupin domain-containing protein [Caldalkalibacillus mannanilyticus]
MYHVNNPYSYPSPYYVNTSAPYSHNMHHVYQTYPYPYPMNMPMYTPGFPTHFTRIRDYGPEPFVINIEEVTKQNNTFRTALWTGRHLQITLMSINVGEDIGLEVHPHLDQFIRIEEGQGLVRMGDREDRLDFQEHVFDDFAIVIPAGKWHNLINTGDKPLKLYSIYAPPEHPHGTVHQTKAIAEAAEHG